jgi:hypothetical protein
MPLVANTITIELSTHRKDLIERKKYTAMQKTRSHFVDRETPLSSSLIGGPQ